MVQTREELLIRVAVEDNATSALARISQEAAKAGRVVDDSLNQGGDASRELAADSNRAADAISNVREETSRMSRVAEQAAGAVDRESDASARLAREAERSAISINRTRDSRGRLIRVTDQAADSSDRFSRVSRRSLRDVEAQQDKLTKSLIRFGAIAGGAFLAYRTGVAAARLTTRGGIGLVNAASDFEESLAKFQVVFGDFALDASERLRQIGEAAGRSQTELVDYAAQLQDTFVPFGFARDQAAELSTGLVQLAIDVGSFNNKLDADVIRDFQSALVGNTETVRKYGIVASQAAIEQEAIRLGILDANEEITSQQKLLGTLSLIVRGSSDAIGDAERTADSFANTQKRLRAASQELSVVFGRQLQDSILDVLDGLGGVQGATDLIEVGLGAVTGASKVLISFLGSLAESTKAVIDELGGADVVASALAGNIEAGAFAAAAFEIALRNLGEVAGSVFEGIDQSIVTIAGNARRELLNLTGRGVSEVRADLERAQQDLERARSDRAARLETVDESSPLLALNVADRPIREAQARVDALQGELRTLTSGAVEFGDIWTGVFESIQVTGVDTIGQVREALKGLTEVSNNEFSLLGDQLGPKLRDSLIEGAREAADVIGGLFGAGSSGGAGSDTLDLNIAQGDLTRFLRGATTSGGTADDAARVNETSVRELSSGLVEVFRRGIDATAQAVEDYARSREGILNSEDFGGGFGIGIQDQVASNTGGRIGARAGAQLFAGVEDSLVGFGNALLRGENALEAFGDGMLDVLQQILIQSAASAATAGIFGAAQGGRVPDVRYYAGGAFGSRTPDPRDVVPALLRPDEFVLRPEASKRAPAGSLERLNLTGDFGSFAREVGGGGGSQAVQATDVRQTVNLGGINLTISGGSSGSGLDPRAQAQIIRDLEQAIERGIRGANSGLVQAVRQAAGRRPA